MNDEPLIEISDPDQDRYARLRLMSGYSHETIRQAKVMVVGAGALGNEVLKNLALLGIGHVFIVDFDTIETSNLTRSVLFRLDDRGRTKAEVAAEHVSQLNPDVKTIACHGDITHAVGLGVFRAMDLVIGCLDNRQARMAVNRACWRVGRPWVDGALDVADGSVRVFIPGAGACYECLMTKQDYALANLRYSCPPGTVMEGVAITTPMSASIIGAMQAQEAVKLLHGHPVVGGQGVYYSAETLRTTQVSYPRREGCPAHESFEPVMSLPYGVDDLTVGDLIRLVEAEHGEKVRLILPDKIVTYLYCPRCDQVEAVFRPLRLVTPDQLVCACGGERVYDVASSLAGGEHTNTVPLARLGFPPLDILDLRSRAGHVYVEMGGDQTRILHW